MFPRARPLAFLPAIPESLPRLLRPTLAQHSREQRGFTRLHNSPHDTHARAPGGKNSSDVLFAPIIGTAALSVQKRSPDGRK